MIDLKRPIAELAAEVRSGKLSAVELVQASLDHIAQTQEFHTVLEVANAAALKRAAEIDARIKRGENPGVLAGIPYIAKDNFLTRDTSTTAASNILHRDNPFKAPYQSTAVEHLEAAGAIMVAKANLDAFAHGSSTENSDFGPTLNPWDKQRVPGGSSGGSAASVALGQACFAIGTDTGGSIRLPASYCGVVGLKPTYGLVSRSGVIAMGSSFDTIGPLAHSVEDAALVLDVMAGRDTLDATTIDRENSYVDFDGDLKGLKIGLVKEYIAKDAGVDEQARTRVLEIADKLKSRGAIITEVSLPSIKYGLACYYVLVPAEVSSNLSRFDGVKYGYSASEATNLAETYDLSRGQGFGAEAKRRIMTGTYVLSSGYYDAYYKKAQRVRTRLIKEFEDRFKDVDMLMGLTAPGGAFKLGQNPDPVSMYLADIMTVAANIVGVPSISIPMGLEEAGGTKLPLGLQLMAPQRHDAKLLATAHQIESLLGRLEAPV